MAQAVEHAIYQGWTEVKTAQLALPQPDNQRAAAPIGVSELMEYVAGQLTQMEAVANPDRHTHARRTRAHTHAHRLTHTRTHQHTPNEN